jgi:hypothetical protein
MGCHSTCWGLFNFGGEGRYILLSDGWDGFAASFGMVGYPEWVGRRCAFRRGGGNVVAALLMALYCFLVFVSLSLLVDELLNSFSRRYLGVVLFAADDLPLARSCLSFCFSSDGYVFCQSWRST